MAVLYVDSGSFNELEVSSSLLISGSGASILSVSGSTGPIMQVSDLTAGANVFQITSASIDVFKIDQSKNIFVSGALIVTGSISLNGSAIGAGGAGAVESYFQNVPVNVSINTTNLSSVQNLIQPFQLPYDISVSYVRIPVSVSVNSTQIATTANTSIRYNQSHTVFANFYSLGTGANSKSLQYITQASVSFLHQASATEGANSAAQTNNFVTSYFTEGVTSATGASTMTVAASSVFNFTNNAAGLSNFTGYRMVDIPFATSLSAGEYWVAFQRSSTFGSTGATNITGASANLLFAIAQQTNLPIYYLGQATNVNTNQMQLGLGIWSATTQGGTTNSIALSQISSTASQPIIPFQLIRIA